MVTHGKCGKSWVQRGDRTSHCGTCHETFSTLTAFDAHFLRDEAGRPHCGDPATMTRTNGAARFVIDTDGHWNTARDVERRHARIAALGLAKRDSSASGTSKVYGEGQASQTAPEASK